jgi:hypothetical protein
MMIPTDEYSSADGDSSPKYGMIGFDPQIPHRTWDFVSQVTKWHGIA